MKRFRPAVDKDNAPILIEDNDGILVLYEDSEMAIMKFQSLVLTAVEGLKIISAWDKGMQKRAVYANTTLALWRGCVKVATDTLRAIENEWNRK